MKAKGGGNDEQRDGDSGEFEALIARRPRPHCAGAEAGDEFTLVARSQGRVANAKRRDHRRGWETHGTAGHSLRDPGKDAERTQSYYSELFGWDIEPLPFENPTQYGLVNRDGNTNGEGVGIGGGVGAAPEGLSGHVTFYVEVPDVEDALVKAESLGGKRTMGPDQVPGGPVIGLFEDPDGNTVGAVQAE